jgi:TonB family protein
MADEKNDIEKYRSGELTSQESYALEKKALQDPFLADAIEGAESISAENFSNDIAELKSSIAFQSEERSIASFERVAAASSPPPSMRVVDEKQFNHNPPKVVKKWTWPLRVAASILIMFFIFFVANRLIPKQGKETLVIKEEKAKSAGVDTLSILQNKVNPNLAKSAEERPQPPSQLKPAIAFNRKPEKAVVEKDDNILSDVVEEGGKATEVTPNVESRTTESIAAAEQPTPVVKMEAPIATTEPELKKKAVSDTDVHPIKGQVISEEDGIPIPGVNVIVKGTTIGAVTDMNGNYELPEVKAGQELTFSFVGFASQEVLVANQKDINVKLGADISQLSEIVVVGYGSQKDPEAEPVIKNASPAGGLRAFNKYLDDSVRYPIEALELKIKGKVIVQFTVGTNGSLNDFIVKKSIGHGCDEEVIRLVKEGPAWSPTTEDNVAVESNVLVKLRFDPAKAKK